MTREDVRTREILYHNRELQTSSKKMWLPPGGVQFARGWATFYWVWTGSPLQKQYTAPQNGGRPA
jgi:hypothetical protein